MPTLHDQRGTTLLEALFAASLLTTLVAGTAALIVLAHRVGARTEEAATATLLAGDRLQALRAAPWRYEIDGTVPDLAALAYSPPGALDHETSGYSDVTDDAGRTLANLEDDAPAFVRRWAISPVLAGPAQGRALEVCVFTWPADRHPVPLVCLAGVRTRQP
jgi:hypothetical protein